MRNLRSHQPNKIASLLPYYKQILSKFNKFGPRKGYRDITVKGPRSEIWAGKLALGGARQELEGPSCGSVPSGNLQEIAVKQVIAKTIAQSNIVL